ncbi:MAG: type II 3-dehydroquinate dehydratase [Aquiluna sp.]|jgi:3-dehydroquinate dehydratase-2
MSVIYVLNGPNLNLLGSREPEVYGTFTLDDLEASLQKWAQSQDETIKVLQTNSEETLIGWIHAAILEKSSVVLNPAAFTHYSYALRDACAALTGAGLLLIEVHITNPHTRETFRHNSVISGVASGVIAGFGVDSYLLALEQLTRR